MDRQAIALSFSILVATIAIFAVIIQTCPSEEIFPVIVSSTEKESEEEENGPDDGHHKVEHDDDEEVSEQDHSEAGRRQKAEIVLTDYESGDDVILDEEEERQTNTDSNEAEELGFNFRQLPFAHEPLLPVRLSSTEYFEEEEELQGHDGEADEQEKTENEADDDDMEEERTQSDTELGFFGQLPFAQDENLFVQKSTEKADEEDVNESTAASPTDSGKMITEIDLERDEDGEIAEEETQSESSNSDEDLVVDHQDLVCDHRQLPFDMSTILSGREDYDLVVEDQALPPVGRIETRAIFLVLLTRLYTETFRNLFLLAWCSQPIQKKIWNLREDCVSRRFQKFLRLTAKGWQIKLTNRKKPYMIKPEMVQAVLGHPSHLPAQEDTPKTFLSKVIASTSCRFCHEEDHYLDQVATLWTRLGCAGSKCQNLQWRQA